MSTDFDDAEIIDQVILKLSDKFSSLPRADIEAAVRAEFEALADRPVRDYLSVLVERAAKKRLKRELTAA